MADSIYSDPEYLRKQREYRKRTGNVVTKRYERTKRGKLMRTYRNMQSRVLGILKKKRHLYDGLPILSRGDFYEWALASDAFHRLYAGWVASGYQCGESPSIDRIDPDRGYVLGNMRWITHRENSANIRRKPSRAKLPRTIDAA